MRHIRNEKGIALVMVLIFSMIGLAIVSAMLFMLTQGSRMSGAFRMYRSADEAGLGGAGLVTEMIKNRGVNPAGTTLFSGALDACLQQKLNTARGLTPTDTTASAWTSCGTTFRTDARLSIDPACIGCADMTVDLPGPLGTTFRTYTKIVDTVQGNSDTGGIVAVGTLSGGGVVTAAGGQISPPPIPYLYRIEVQTQNQQNPNEKSRYSVLYAY